MQDMTKIILKPTLVQWVNFTAPRNEKILLNAGKSKTEFL